MLKNRSMTLGFPPFTAAVKWLVGITSGVYLLLLLLQNVQPNLFSAVELRLALIPYATAHGWIWQIATYSLLHAGLWHLLGNMLGIWMFGSQLELDLGTRRFVELFYFSVIGAALVTIGVAFANALGMSPLTPTVGASGGTYGLLMAYGIMYAEREIFLMLPPVSIKAKYFVAILIFIAAATSLQGGGGIASLAHLGGLLFGYIYIKFIPRYGMTTSLTEWLFGLRNRYHKHKRRQAAKKFEVFMRDHDRSKYFDEHGNFRAPGDGENGQGSNKGGWVN
jgi:membrane associated rhomboid family serine protease